MEMIQKHLLDAKDKMTEMTKKYQIAAEVNP